MTEDGGLTDIMDNLADITEDMQNQGSFENEKLQNLNEKLKANGFQELTKDQVTKIATDIAKLSDDEKLDPADVKQTAEEIAKTFTGNSEPSVAVTDGIENNLNRIVENIAEDKASEPTPEMTALDKWYEKYANYFKTPEGQAEASKAILNDENIDTSTKKLLTKTIPDKVTADKLVDSINKLTDKIDTKDPKEKSLWEKFKQDLADNWGKYTLLAVIITIGSIIAADEYKQYKDARSGCFVTKKDSNGKTITHCKVMALTCGDGASDTSEDCSDPDINKLTCNTTNTNSAKCKIAVPSLGSNNNTQACKDGTIQDGFASIYCDDQYIVTSDGTYTYHFNAEENAGPIADIVNEITKIISNLPGDAGDLLDWLKKIGMWIGIGLAIIIVIWIAYSVYSHFSGGSGEKVEIATAPAAPVTTNHFRPKMGVKRN